MLIIGKCLSILYRRLDSRFNVSLLNLAGILYLFYIGEDLNVKTDPHGKIWVERSDQERVCKIL